MKPHIRRYKLKYAPHWMWSCGFGGTDRLLGMTPASAYAAWWDYYYGH